MGKNNEKPDNGSRRWFLSLFTSAGKKAITSEKVKMLTADGKLVEIDRHIYDKAVANKKSSNKEIFDWMENPSKENQ